MVKILVEILQPYNGRVYDPCCGSGGMFVQLAKFIENHGGNINKISVFGQDSNPTTWKMAQMNLANRGIEADLGKFNAGSFFDFMVAGSKGNKMPCEDKQQIMNYPVVPPTDTEMEEFNSVAAPIVLQIQYNRNENKLLSSLRDALLPKLMNGEIYTL